MNISSATFIFLFLPCCVAAYYLIPAKNGLKLRNYFLVLASLFFYAWGEPVRVLLLMGLIVATWGLGLWVDGKRGTAQGKRIVALSVIMNVAILFVYKYLDFTLRNIGYIVGKEFNSFDFALPLGMSFLAFQSISYVVDIYRGKNHSQKNVLDTALYLALFFKVISGPVTQYNQFEDQITNRTVDWDKFSKGLIRVVIGLAKKVILATNFEFMVNAAYNADFLTMPVSLAWLGNFAYMMQLYFDFSGYSDMAIGLGWMFGFDIKENFIYPYMSTSVTKYWQKWHITMAEWFRDYMYYPFTLGPGMKMRKNLTKKYNRDVAKFITNFVTITLIWATTGLWHAAAWPYILWGIINGLFQLWEIYRKPFQNKTLDSAFGWFYTILLSFFIKTMCHLDTMGECMSYYGAMFGAHGNIANSSYVGFLINEYKWFIIIGIIACTPLYKYVREKVYAKGNKTITNIWKFVEMICIIGLFIVTIAYVEKGGYTAFIYQKF